MANALNAYNPTFYAQEALIWLMKSLGLASRVHRSVEAERRAYRKGEVITIRRPSTFTAEDAPGSVQDLATEQVQMTLDKWKTVKFTLTDKELAFTDEIIIRDHIGPAAYALAENIDSALAGLFVDIPWIYDLNSAGSLDVTDITGPRKVLFENEVPMNPAMLHYMISPTLEAEFLGLPAFSQQQGAGDMGINTQINGSLGRKFGLNPFATQNVKTHTAGALTGSPITNGTFAKGVASVDLDAGSLTGTVKIGDTFKFAGHSQRYVATADATASGNAITVAFSPTLAVAVGDGVAATFDQSSAENNVAFHEHAFALVTVPLTEMGNEMGAKVATVTHPSGISLRSRMWYEADASEVRVALDVLYGIKTLNPNLAVRGQLG